MFQFSGATAVPRDTVSTHRVKFLAGASKSALCAAWLAASLPAVAQDQTIDDERTSQVRTSEIIGPEAGRLTIGENGSIIADITPLIIDGPHSVDILGILANRASENSVGVLVDTSDLRLVSDIEFLGELRMLGADPDNIVIANQNNLTGFRLEGANGFEGTFALRGGSSVTVSGLNSTGVSIATDVRGGVALNGFLAVRGDGGRAAEVLGDLRGNFTMNGSIEAAGTNGQILFVDGDISGRVTLGGAYVAGAGQAPQVDGVAVNGRDAFVFNGNVDGGILFEGAGQDNVTTDEDGNSSPRDGSLGVNGGGSAVVIENTRPADGALTIGRLSGEEYGIISRYVKSVQSNDLGLNVVGMRVGGGVGGAVNIEGGIFFDTGAVVSGAADGEAIGLLFGEGANVPRLDLSGVNATVSASTTTVIQSINDELVEGPGGDAIGVMIAAGATLSSINNGGDIGALAAGENALATGILDLSGSLTSIVNSGDIQAIAGSSTGARPIAIDVRANTSGVSVINTGDITGDIYFGAGDDRLEVDGGEVVGAVNFGEGVNTLALINGASILGDVNFDGGLNLSSEGSVIGLQNGAVLRATNVSIGEGSFLLAQVDPISGTSGLLQVANDLAFTSAVPVNIQLLSFSAAAQEFVLANARSVSGVELADLTLGDELFLFNKSFGTQVADGGREDLVLTLTPRSAEELGLSEQFGQVYEHIQLGLVPDDQVGVALANLNSSRDVRRAFADLAPDITNRLFEATLSNQRILTRNFSERLDDFIDGAKNPGGTWAVEHGAIGQIDSENTILNSNYTNFGLSVGYTGRFTEGLAFGFGAGFSLFGAETNSGFGSDISVFAPYATSYLLGTYGIFYGGISGTATYLDVERDRRLAFVAGEPLIESQSNGWALTGTAELGLDIDLGGLNIKPYGQLSAHNLTENGYQEVGGSGAQEIGDRQLNFVEGTGGLSLSYDIVLEKNRDGERILRPEIYGGVSRHLSGDLATSFDARFLESERSLSLDGDLMNANTEFAGAAVSIFGTGSTARIRYQYEDRGLMTTHSATLNFKLIF